MTELLLSWEEFVLQIYKLKHLNNIKGNYLIEELKFC